MAAKEYSQLQLLGQTDNARATTPANRLPQFLAEATPQVSSMTLSQTCPAKFSQSLTHRDSGHEEAPSHSLHQLWGSLRRRTGSGVSC